MILRNELYEQIKEAVQALKAGFRDALADGKITLAELWLLVQHLVIDLVGIVNGLDDLSPERRKEAILELVDEVYADVIAPIDLPWVPEFIERSLVDPILGIALHEVVSRLLDQYGGGQDGKLNAKSKA